MKFDTPGGESTVEVETADDDHHEALEAEIEDLRERIDVAAQEAVDARNDDEIAEMRSELEQLQQEKARLKSSLTRVNEELQASEWSLLSLLMWGGLAVVFVFVLGLLGNNDEPAVFDQRGQI